MAIRILHVLDSLANGGMENGVVSLVNHMDESQFENYVCTISGLGINADRLAADRVRLVSPAAGTRSRFQLPQLTRLIRETRPALVHSNNWGAIEAILAARIAGARAVHTEHGFDGGPSAPQPARRSWFRRFAYQVADRVLCVSRELKESLVRQTGVQPRRLTVLHNGVDCRRFFPDATARERIRREFQLGDAEFVIGCVGNLLPVKDHMTLLSALRQLGGVAKDWRVMIVGDGPERPRLEAAVRELPADGARVMLPGISNRVPGLLAALDVYVLPSISEGLSYSLLEAMATALPVIATNVGGNPEAVEDGISGLLFPAGDTPRLCELLMRANSEWRLRERLGDAARRRVEEKFSIAAMVRNYQRVYRSVLPVMAAQVGAEA